MECQDCNYVNVHMSCQKCSNSRISETVVSSHCMGVSVVEEWCYSQ